MIKYDRGMLRIFLMLPGGIAIGTCRSGRSTSLFLKLCATGCLSNMANIVLIFAQFKGCPGDVSLFFFRFS